MDMMFPLSSRACVKLKAQSNLTIAIHIIWEPKSFPGQILQSWLLINAIHYLGLQTLPSSEAERVVAIPYCGGVQGVDEIFQESFGLELCRFRELCFVPMHGVDIGNDHRLSLDEIPFVRVVFIG